MFHDTLFKPHLPQQRLYLRPDLHAHGALRLCPAGGLAGADSITGRPRSMRVGLPCSAPAAPPGAAGAAAGAGGLNLPLEPPSAACDCARSATVVVQLRRRSREGRAWYSSSVVGMGLPSAFSLARRAFAARTLSNFASAVPTSRGAQPTSAAMRWLAAVLSVARGAARSAGVSALSAGDAARGRHVSAPHPARATHAGATHRMIASCCVNIATNVLVASEPPIAAVAPAGSIDARLDICRARFSWSA